MTRKELLTKLSKEKEWDVIVIGGGASGLGTAFDSTLRGHKTVLFEIADFAKGTSSRSTKLVHGGVRYLQQGNLSLVKEALRERGLIAQNAAHLVHDLKFILPNYSHWKGIYYLTGLKLYDVLAGSLSIGKTVFLNREAVVEHIPTIQKKGLKNGVLYYDGQFDDARLAINLAQSINENSGLAINHMGITNLLKDHRGRIKEVTVKDNLSGDTFNVRGKVIVNATGVFTDDILNLDNPFHKNTIVPSQGIHLVVDKSFLPT